MSKIEKPSYSNLQEEGVESNIDAKPLDQELLDKKEIVIGDYDQAPDYIKDNEFLKGGYRLNCITYQKIFKSLFVCHNDSVNVWLHLLGTIGAIVLIFYTAIFVSSYKEKISSYIDYDTLLTELRDITNPWITTFDRDTVIETQDMFSMVDLIKNKTDDFFTAIKSKLEIVHKIHSYIDNIKDIMYNVSESFKSKPSEKSDQNLFSKISSAWNTVQNKLYSVIYGDGLKYDESTEVEQEKGEQTTLRRWPIFIMLSSAIVCLSFSTLFHWFGALSPKSSQILSRLDYAGITILIAGSCYPPYFYFFYCEIYLCTVYLSFISIFAISVFVFALTPDFYVPRRRRLRGTLFLTLGLSAGIPIVHLILFGSHVTGFSGYEITPRYYLWVLGGASYVIGALIYINRIPEKYVPRTFDYFGASHQIFHLLVVVGVVLHYCGSLDAFYYRSINSCPSNM